MKKFQKLSKKMKKSTPNKPKRTSCTTSLLLALTLGLLITESSQFCGDGCKKCKGSTCLKCKEGFGLSETHCYECVIDNCKNCDGDQEGCIACNDYFFFDSSSGSCNKCPIGCKNCDGINLCLSCGFTFSLNKGICSLNYFSLFLVLIGFFSPIFCVWTCAFYTFVKTEPTVDEDGKIIIPRLKKQQSNRFNGKSMIMNNKFTNFLFDYTKYGSKKNAQESTKEGFAK